MHLAPHRQDQGCLPGSHVLVPPMMRLVRFSSQRTRAKLFFSFVAAAAMLVIVTPAIARTDPAQLPTNVMSPDVAKLADTAPLRARDTLLSNGSPVLKQSASSAWQGGVYTTFTGETVRIFASDYYSYSSTANQSWADFFASLIHNSELSKLTVYLVPFYELQYICGSGALACYAPSIQSVVLLGNWPAGFPAAQIAAHEYGHHIANNRVNPPWVAVDWGTKRWASYANVCNRAATGTAFPADEGANYSLNPGEAFAETYRLLNAQRRTWAPVQWNVDGSFFPDAGALAAVEQDVRSPWALNTDVSTNSRFKKGGTRVRTFSLNTASDGALTISVPARPGFGLRLFADGGQIIAQTNGGAMTYALCGVRHVTIRVYRTGLAGRFALETSTP